MAVSKLTRVRVDCWSNIIARETSLSRGQTHALLLHLLQQQANIKQFVDLVHAPVAQTVHVHVMLVLHNPHSFFLAVRLLTIRYWFEPPHLGFDDCHFTGRKG